MSSGKNENRILIFFTCLAILFWNPLSFYLLYKNTTACTYTSLHLAYWLVFGAALLHVFLLLKNKVHAFHTRLITGFSVAGILFALLVLTDRLLPAKPETAVPLAYRHPERQGLVFVPNASLHHQTAEFNYTAVTNSFGLRQAEMQAQKNGKFRILCVGDSWTYGWGVSTDKAFPQQLEKILHAAGYRQVEVINAGQPGQHPATYRQNMERLIPFLQPDMLLLGVLQVEDMVQEFENNQVFAAAASLQNHVSFLQKIQSAGREYLKGSFKHMLAALGFNLVHKVSFNQDVMKASCEEFINQFSYLEKVRFLSLNDSVQQMFISGNLNPGLLRYYINFPDLKTVFNNPAHPYTRLALQSMSKELQQMNRLCRQHHCKPVFINMPFNYFSGHHVIRTPDDFMEEQLLNNNKVDSMYKSLALGVQWPYIELTGHFTSLSNKEAYYFRYDGHPNENGYREIARYVALSLEKQNLIPARRP